MSDDTLRGANLDATGLDGGTALHQAAWFGQPANIQILVDAGADLEVFDPTHSSSPLGWAVHGSRYSGMAAQRQAVYTEAVTILLDAGARLHYPGTPHDDSYRARLIVDASADVKTLLEATYE
jgi:ankyrin repeat protein